MTTAILQSKKTEAYLLFTIHKPKKKRRIRKNSRWGGEGAESEDELEGTEQDF